MKACLLLICLVCALRTVYCSNPSPAPTGVPTPHPTSFPSESPPTDYYKSSNYFDMASCMSNSVEERDVIDCADTYMYLWWQATASEYNGRWVDSSFEQHDWLNESACGGFGSCTSQGFSTSYTTFYLQDCNYDYALYYQVGSNFACVYGQMTGDGGSVGTFATDFPGTVSGFQCNIFQFCNGYFNGGGSNYCLYFAPTLACIDDYGGEPFDEANLFVL